MYLSTMEAPNGAKIASSASTTAAKVAQMTRYFLNEANAVSAAFAAVPSIFRKVEAMYAFASSLTRKMYCFRSYFADLAALGDTGQRWKLIRRNGDPAFTSNPSRPKLIRVLDIGL